MKILISGICGFVGNSVAAYLKSAMAGVEVFGVDNFVRAGSELNRAALLERGIRTTHADLRLWEDVESLPAADFVIDAAALASVLAGTSGHASSRVLVDHNLGGTVNLLEYCKTHRAGLILLSTSRVYSTHALANLPVREEGDRLVLNESASLPPGVSGRGLTEAFSTQAPVSLYGSTKLASETLALEYGAAFGFPVWINRCGVLAGAGQFGRADQGIFSYWLHAWKAGRPLRYIGFGGGGRQVRDMLHPYDLARLLVQQLHLPGSQGRTVHVSGGAERSMSLRQLSAWCTERWGAQEVLPQVEERPYDAPWIVLDSSRATVDWMWKPEIDASAILEEIAEHAEAHPRWLELATL